MSPPRIEDVGGERHVRPRHEGCARTQPQTAIEAGRVGRPHGLDGSFYVTGACPRLLQEGVTVRVDGEAARIVRRAGLDARPIVRLEGIEDRSAVESLNGRVLTVERSSAPPLDENEWWAGELEGCEVVDGDRKVGIVCRLLELPSCEALEVRMQGTNEQLLIPMVSDAIRSVNVVKRSIDVDMSFLEAAD